MTQTAQQRLLRRPDQEPSGLLAMTVMPITTVIARRARAAADPEVSGCARPTKQSLSRTGG